MRKEFLYTLIFDEVYENMDQLPDEVTDWAPPKN